MRTAKKFFLIVVILYPSVLLAQVKIAVVDLQKAIASSSVGKKAQKDYEAEVKAAQSSLDKKKETFEEQKEAYENQKESLNEKAREEKEEKLLSTQRDLKRSFQDAQEKLRRKNSVIIEDLLKDLKTVVEQIAQNGDYTIVLDKGAQSVLYSSESIDITETVIEKFDKKTSKK